MENGQERLAQVRTALIFQLVLMGFDTKTAEKAAQWFEKEILRQGPKESSDDKEEGI